MYCVAFAQRRGRGFDSPLEPYYHPAQRITIHHPNMWFCLKQFAIILGWQHHTRMKAYSMDLRRKVVDAVFSGRPKAQVARSFGVGISTVKRYASKAESGESLAPKSPPGKRRKLDEVATKLLAEDLEAHPAATLEQRREYLERVAG